MSRSVALLRALALCSLATLALIPTRDSVLRAQTRVGEPHAAASRAGAAYTAVSRVEEPLGVRNTDQQRGGREAMLRVARDIMHAARFCALITRDASTGTSARTIDPAPPDSAMVVRFVTNPRSRKVQQLAADARVALYYFDATAQRYATLYGRAIAISNPVEKARRWYEGWTPFYPQRERDATLYEVIPDRIELVSPADSVLGDSLSWATSTIRFPPPRRVR